MGIEEGTIVGSIVVGCKVGWDVIGEVEGCMVGSRVGADTVGNFDGIAVGFDVGCTVGSWVGFAVG